MMDDASISISTFVNGATLSSSSAELVNLIRFHKKTQQCRNQLIGNEETKERSRRRVALARIHGIGALHLTLHTTHNTSKTWSKMAAFLLLFIDAVLPAPMYFSPLRAHGARRENNLAKADEAHEYAVI